MVAVLIFVFSAAALAQFGLYYWRANISATAAREISERIRVAAGLTHPAIGAQDFHNILILNNLSPDLRGPNGSFRSIRAYYAVVETLGRIIPGIANWAEAEMATCSRYVAVLMDQHLKRNIACAAQVRGI
jgi:hypothetical protein